jgi:hypothetical protein
MGQEMMKMMKISTPVLLDANILIRFKGQLGFLFGFFDNIVIHKQVYNEVVGQALNKELDTYTNIKYVEDYKPADSIEKLLFDECDKELKQSFNIANMDDLGEYKTLLYAKFNNVKILSSQDTTVWRFLTESKFFMGIDCITIQDLAYLLYINAKNKQDRKLAKTLYERVSREEHPFDCFKLHMVRNEDRLPQYIAFENNRINNFKELVNGYIECYALDSYIDKIDIENELTKIAQSNAGTCLSCIYSRVDKNYLDLSIRTCFHKSESANAECANRKEEFMHKIRTREKKVIE